jgi:hypothetical protein
MGHSIAWVILSGRGIASCRAVFGDAGNMNDKYWARQFMDGLVVLF